MYREKREREKARERKRYVHIHSHTHTHAHTQKSFVNMCVLVSWSKVGTSLTRQFSCIYC